MTEHMRHEYRAYLWTLAALVLVYFGTIIAAATSPALIGKLEAFGLGTVTGGLIGLLRTPRQAHTVIPSHPLELNQEAPRPDGGGM